MKVFAMKRPVGRNDRGKLLKKNNVFEHIRN